MISNTKSSNSSLNNSQISEISQQSTKSNDVKVLQQDLNELSIQQDVKQEVKQNNQTILEQFYQQVSTPEVFTLQNMKDLINSLENFDKEEFAKPIQDINMKLIVDKLDYKQLGGIWITPEQKGNKSKPTIVKYTPKSNVLGLDKYVSFHIKNAKSKFCSHSFAFGDANQKQLLSKPLQELIDNRTEDDYKEFKKLAQMNFDFDLVYKSSNQNTQKQYQQSDEFIEYAKYIMLIQYIIGYAVACDYNKTQTIDSKYLEINGVISEKFDAKLDTDIIKMGLVSNIIPMYKTSPVLEACIVKDYNLQYDNQPIETQDVFNYTNSISEICKLLSLKTIDLVIIPDSCCVKKQGRNTICIPKFQLKQVILKPSVQQSYKHIGLRLLNNNN